MQMDLRRTVDEFAANPPIAAKAMRALLERDINAFFQAALPLVREGTYSPGHQYLLMLLLNNSLLLKPLCDPGVFTLGEAVAIARDLKHVDPAFDLHLFRALFGQNGQDRGELEEVAGSAAGLRVLSIIAEISDGTRLVPVMTQLLRHRNSHVRSKAALLVGRSNKNHRWVEQRLLEDDPRVRANAVESLWGAGTNGSRAVFWNAVSDADNRVAGNAVLGLFRLGDPASIRLIDEFANHTDAKFRSTAAWVMGETGDPRFVPLLGRMMAESEPEVRASALVAIAKLKKCLAARSTATRLRILMGEIRRRNEDWCDFSVGIWPERRAGIAELRASNFAIWEDSSLVSEYEVEQSGKDPLALGLAFARVLERSSPEQEAQDRAIERALRHKRRVDLWTVLKYVRPSDRDVRAAAPAQALPAHATAANAVLGALTSALPNEEVDLLTSTMRLSADPSAITDAVAVPGPRSGCASNLNLALRALMDVLTPVRASRHVVLVCQSPLDAFSLPTAREIRTAELANIVVHIIAHAPSDAMYELCHTTGGHLLVPHGSEGIPDLLESLCAALTNAYHIKYRSRHPLVSALKLQVYTDKAIGEVTRTLPPSSNAQAFDSAATWERVADARPSSL